MSAAPPLAEGFQPWLGLLPYSEADQELFFGRESDTQDLLRLVRREVVTVLFGRSGTGKSSLLRAGLFPKLRQEQFLPIWIRLDHSGRTSYGRQVRAEIESAITTRQIEVEMLAPPLVGDDTDDVWEYLHRVVFWDAKNQPVTPVLVFDQFEELFTLGHNRPEITAFFEELAAIAENLIPQRLREIVIADAVKLPAVYNERHYKLMISLREDYVSRLDSLSKDMPSVMHNRHALSHMTGEQALEVVLKPGGDLVEEPVARKIVRFVAAANDAEAVVAATAQDASHVDMENLRVEPALLSLVCSELNLQRLKENRAAITLEQVQRSSDQILEDFYERSLDDLDGSDRSFIEDRLVTASGFRTTVPVEEANLAGLNDEEIEKLVARRLLRKEDRLGTPHIELTHDVLTKVVARSRGFRQQREEEEISRLEKQKQADEMEKIRQREELENLRIRRMRNDRRAIWIAIGLSTALATIAVILLISRNAVKRAEQLASARSLALRSIGVLEQDPELALLLSLESALTTFPDSKASTGAPPEIEASLRTATMGSLVRRRFEGHTSKVYSVDFDPDGRRLLTGAWRPDSTARIWDSDSGKEIARLDLAPLPGGKTTISCARFSPDGRKVVTTTYRDDGAVYLWDVSTMHGTGGPSVVTSKPLLTFTGHHSWVTTAAFSPDGKIIATGGYDNVVRLWDPESGQEVSAPLGSGRIRHTKRIRSVTFNADGTRLLSSSDDGNAILWDVSAALKAGIPMDPATLEVIQVFAGNPNENLHDADLNPAGTRVATVGNDRHVRIWDANSGEELAAQGHPDSVMGVAFIDDSRIVTVCNDAAIRFWVLGNAADPAIGSFHPDARTVKVLRLTATQKGHQGWIRDVAVSPDRRFIATGGDDGTARLWKLPPGGEIAVLGEPDFRSWAADMHFTKAASGKPAQLTAYAGTGSGSIRALDAFTERDLEDWGPLAADEIRHTAEVRSISASPNGKDLVTSSSDQTAIVWNAATGRPRYQITGHQGPAGGTIYQARFSADSNHIVTASNEGCARVWDARTGAPGIMLVPPRREIGGDGIENFGHLLAKLRTPADAASSYVASQISAEDVTRMADRGAAQAIVVEALNRLVGGPSLDAEPALRSVVRRPMTAAWAKRNPTGADLKTLNRLMLEDAFPNELTRCRIYDARFDRDGKLIVTADFEARTATVWEVKSGRPLRIFAGHSDPKSGHSDNVMGAAFTPDGAHVVTACMDGFARIWDVSSGQLVQTIPHGIAVRSAEFSPDGKLLLTAAADGVARIWTLPGYKPRTDLRGSLETLTDARFSNDGAHIITSSRDGTARIYHTHAWWIYSLATQRVTRKLTPEERSQYRVTRKLTAEERAYYQQKKTATQ